MQRIFQKLFLNGYFGTEFKAMMECSHITWVEQTGFPDFEGTSFSVKQTLKDLTSEAVGVRLRQKYRQHNMYCIGTVPSEDLLVWNVKDGWEPLCKFLGKSIPTNPFPYDNRTGDAEFVADYVFKTKIWRKAEKTFQKTIIFDICKISLLGYLTFKCIRLSL